MPDNKKIGRNAKYNQLNIDRRCVWLPTAKYEGMKALLLLN